MKNASRKNNKSKVNNEIAKKAAGETLYRVETKRDSKVLLAFITFNYRVFHPAVTARMVFYGILVILPGFFVKATWATALFFGIGALLVLLGLCRQYISLALTKSQDADYKAGTVFTYDFTDSNIAILKNDEVVSYAKYKDITGFYYDDQFYYLTLKGNEFHILPKTRFTEGDEVSFDDYIYSKSRKVCQWIPAKLQDKMAKRRALRDLSK